MAALAILGVAGGLVGPAIEVVKWIYAPVRCQFNYLCCFHSNINDLKGEAKILDNETRGVQMKVDSPTNNAQLILPPVETWLRNSEEMKNGINGILDQVPNVGSGCLKLTEPYSLSKKAKKATIAIKEHIVEKCKFTEISHPPPPASTALVQSGTTTYEFGSRREIEEEIMKSLGSKNVNKIGISGMGGLGKTTMAEKIMNRALKEGLFDEVVMAVVSQPVDKLNIQLQIAGPLGLRFEDDILISRANLLRERLRGKKKTLLLLDDAWESLNIEELGIPCEDGCKVLITSRNNGILRAMDVEKVCQLKILDEKEAWILFEGKAGTCVDDVVLKPIAKDVMRECKGLPLALVIVGVALKDENGVSIWEDALGQLRRSNPADIPSIIEQVYNPLKLSYDRLGNPNAKSMFLLCCLFPEDIEIPLKHLVFATGLHLFEDIWELKEVRGRTSALIKTLKTRGLLLDGEDEGHVRMHDVARDVSIFIASKERRIKCTDCTWISSHMDGGTGLVPPLQSFFPKLKLLFMKNQTEQEMEINKDYLNGESTELNVLFIKCGLLKSLPLIISLTTLILYGCDSLESIAVVGQFKSLEILICSRCRSIKELPEQLRGLKCLKRLQISECLYLERVARGVISSMVAVEELKIVDGFDNWKYWEIEEGGKEATSIACLREIESLKKLRWLDIQVSDIALAAQPLRLSPESLVRFTVRFGKYKHDMDKRYERRMSLDFGRTNYTNWGDLSANIFLSRTECLSALGLHEDFKLNLATAQSIRWLSLEKFTNKKNITSAAAAFPLLEYLSLEGLPNLIEIWDDDAPIPSNSFTNLKHMRLNDLQALKRMGKSALSTAKDFFLQLETIKIKDCNEMEHLLVLVPKDKEDDIKTVLIFPKLKKLRLDHVGNLMSICSRGIESIQFPLLAGMKINSCENLRWLVSDDHHQDDADDDSVHLFCHTKVSFDNLRELRFSGTESKNVWCDHVRIGFFTGLVSLDISSCYKIRSLFSSSKVPQNLVNLRILKVGWCDEMVKVIEDEEEVSISSTSCDQYPTKHIIPLFRSLQEIQLAFLPKLECFCGWKCALELPSLKSLQVDECREIKSFNAAGLIITPALQAVTLHYINLECVEDLNAALQQGFEDFKLFEEWKKKKDAEHK